MVKRVLFLLIFSSICSVVGAESFSPFEATLSESAALNKTSELLSPELVDCVPLKGTLVRVTDQTAVHSQPRFFSRIEVLEGPCEGTVGWVETSKLQSAR